MELVGIFLRIMVFAVFFVVLSHMLPFFRGRPYFSARESTLRILLISFLIFAPLFLASIFLSPLFKIGVEPFMEKITVLWPTDKAMAIFAPATIFFLIVAGLSIPLAGLFHYLFGFGLFVRANKKYELSPKAIEENAAIRELLDIFSHCLNVAGQKKLEKVFLLDEGPGTSPIFSGCGIVGRGESLVLLFSKDFVKAFKDKQLKKEEIEAVFFHEIAHITNKDYFLPLWSKMFIRSRLFFIAWASLVASAICASAAFIKIEGLIAVLDWNLFSKVIILTFGFILLKGVIKILISETLRGREYLADKHAIYHYSDRDAMIAAIKKSALLFTGTGRFSWLSFDQADSGVYGKAPEKEDVFTEMKQLFSDILGRKAIWHPNPVKRIKALDERRIGLKKECSTKDIIFSTLIVIVFLLGVSLLVEFLLQKWRAVEYVRIYGMLNLFLILFYFLVICGLAAEHILPLQFWNTALFRKSLSGSWTLFLIGKAWMGIHIKNLFVALIPSLLGSLVARFFYTKIGFFHWLRLHFVEMFLALFAFATLFSIFLIASYWKQKKKKPPEGEEVPAEGIIE